MADLPTGTVTFVFTDIEGSTHLWEQYPEAMRTALTRHHALIAAEIERREGVVVKSQGEGDSVFAVFARATDAVTAACALQRALIAEPWPAETPVRVRVALHTGEAELRDGDYYGAAVNRCARLRAAAHGGQVLLSLATQELTRDHLPEGASLRDLRERRLKDLIRPEHIFQLAHPDLPLEFPPLATLDLCPNNLPAQATTLIGREKAVAEARDLLRRNDLRLLTLTGPGGAGKTRLGLQVAADLVDDFQDGVFFVGLAPITDPGLVASTIGQVLGAREEGSRPLLESLKEHLRDKQLLLVLDNFEQVWEAGPLVSDLLAAAPRLKVLVTSREVLHLRGEQEFSVPALAVPDPKRLPPLPALSQYAGVELFIQRALNIKPDFAVTNQNAPAVAEICYRLDGLPLAIELAAARVKLISPEALLPRLESRLKLLTGGARDLPARQQTLRSAIAWSYDLLDEAERTLFWRLSVFVGGWPLGAAEAVCNPRSGALGALEIDLLDGVASLVDKSLVRQEPDTSAGHPPREGGGGGGEPRFGMLETIREFGLECLAASGEEPALRRRHALCYLGLAEKAGPQLVGPEQGVWLDRLDGEHDNLRAAIEWFARAGEAEKGLRLGAALWRFWAVRGYLTEGRERLARLLALPQAAAPTTGRIRALNAAAIMADTQGDYAAARSLFEEILANHRKSGDMPEMAQALTNLGNVISVQGDSAEACSLVEEAVAIFRRLEDMVGASWSLRSLANIAQRQGHYAAARQRYEECLALNQVLFKSQQRSTQEIITGVCVAMNLANLGDLASLQGDYAEAESRYEQSLAAYGELGDSGGMAISLSNLGNMACAQGDYATARSRYEQSLTIAVELGNRQGIAGLLESFAGLAAAQAQPERAFRLAGAAGALRKALGTPLPPEEQTRVERSLEPARQMLPDAEAAAAWAEGQALTLEHAIEDALEKKELP